MQIKNWTCGNLCRELYFVDLCIAIEVFHGSHIGGLKLHEIDLISQGRENVLFLPSNMATMTSHENALYAECGQVKF